MRLKLDENLCLRARELVQAAGHDVSTVPEQSLCSADDDTVMSACRREQRCLVTLDLDFANPLVFPPSSTAGIAVLRLSKRVTLQDMTDALRTLLAGLRRSSIEGKLWVVRRGRIREYQPPQVSEQEGCDP